VIQSEADGLSMFRLGTVDDPAELFANTSTSMATLDIETMDSKELHLWNEPVISYSFSILSGSLNHFSCPTFGAVTEALDQEATLLLELLGFLRTCNEQGITLCGHNLNCSHKYLPTVARSKTEGYDLPKIIKRANSLSLDASFVPSIKTLDTMDQAVQFYDHSQHNHLSPYGEKQRWLALSTLESDLKIIRPGGSQKLGGRVREIYTSYLRSGDQAKVKEIILYNCLDSISESIVGRIFTLCVNECGLCSGLVPPRNRCSRIPSEFRIERMVEWKQLCRRQLTKD
jgi:hypothetical protein